MNQLVLAAFVVVAAAVAPEEAITRKPAPPYHQSAFQYKDALEVINSVIPANSTSPNVDDPAFHFGFLVSTVFDLVETLGDRNNHVSYNDYYMKGVSNGIIAGIVKHKQVVNKLYDLVANIEGQLDPLMHMIYLMNSTDYDIQRLVHDDPAVELQSDLLLAVGKLAGMYLQHTYVEEAEKHTIIAALLDGKEYLKPLISDAISVNVYTKPSIL